MCFLLEDKQLISCFFVCTLHRTTTLLIHVTHHTKFPTSSETAHTTLLILNWPNHTANLNLQKLPILCDHLHRRSLVQSHLQCIVHLQTEINKDRKNECELERDREIDRDRERKRFGIAQNLIALFYSAKKLLDTSIISCSLTVISSSVDPPPSS